MILNDGNTEKKIKVNQFDEDKEYWLTQLSGEYHTKPFLYSQLKDNGEKTNSLKYDLNELLCSKIKTLANGSDYSLHIILIACLATLISKYNEFQEIIIGTPVYKQDNQADEYINTMLPIRVIVDHNINFRGLLIQVRQTVYDAIEHQNFPVGQLPGIDSGNRASEAALYDTTVMLENIHSQKVFDKVAYKILFCFQSEAEKIGLQIKYDPACYAYEDVERFALHFMRVMEQTIDNTEICLRDVELITEQERNAILHEFNGRTGFFPKGKTVSMALEEQVLKTPEAVAVKCEEQLLTYRELNERANRLAWLLKEKGINRDQLAILLCKRSIDMIVGILGVFKAGGAYVPVDISYPIDRVRTTIADSGAKIVISVWKDCSNHETLYGEIFNETMVESILFLDFLDQDKQHNLKIEAFKSSLNNVGKDKWDVLDLSTIISMPCENPPCINKPEDLCYVIYTSGSTGSPKGVLVEHRGMMNHLYAKIQDFRIDESSVIAQNASHCFDISVWQFFSALLVGGRTVIFTDEINLDIKAFFDRIETDSITILEVVPSYLGIILEYLKAQENRLDKLKLLVVTGETLKLNLVNEWFAINPHIAMVNAYGPTEASDDVTHYIMNEPPGSNNISIGVSIQNMNIYILNPKKKLCPIGLIGEIYVSGIGVGRGYLNNPHKTGESFMADPFAAVEGVRMYRTGDLGRWMADGNIEFLGRMDTQVKIRGFRIELGEIENKLLEHPKVKEAVVVVKTNGNGDEYLAGYYVADREVNVREIRDYLEKALPDYMVPAYLISMGDIPLLLNGKVNRKALPEPDKELSGEVSFESPKNETEMKLVEIWSEVLGIKSDKIGVCANIFRVGGDSLKLLIIINKIKDLFGVKIDFNELAEASNIRNLAELIYSKNNIDVRIDAIIDDIIGT
jgi:amino acid adenylation domain-containing protein